MNKFLSLLIIILIVYGCCPPHTLVDVPQTASVQNENSTENISTTNETTTHNISPKDSTKHISPMFRIEKFSATDPVIIMERTVCYGTCPSYVIVIRGDGKVIYVGRKFVEQEGTYERIIPLSLVDSLLSEFEKADFLTLQSEYTGNVSDLPTITTTIKWGRSEKKVIDYYGGPEKLKALEKRIDAVAGIKEKDVWTKVSDNKEINTELLTQTKYSSNNPVITLERTVCFGKCPSYILTIFGDGKAIYKGRKFVDMIGASEKKLPLSAIDSLIAAFEKADFFNLQNEYTAGVTDLPTTIVSIKWNGKEKKVVDYYKAPASLRELEKKIDEIAGTNSTEGWRKISDE